MEVERNIDTNDSNNCSIIMEKAPSISEEAFEESPLPTHLQSRHRSKNVSRHNSIVVGEGSVVTPTKSDNNNNSHTNSAYEMPEHVDEQVINELLESSF